MTVDVVRNYSDVSDNIAYLERAWMAGDKTAIGFVKRGTCFVAYGTRAPYRFAPSRFIGYRDNTFEKHARNSSKDGRVTNPVLSEVLGSTPEPDAELERCYREFCHSLGFEPNATGSFGAERKFWDVRK